MSSLVCIHLTFHIVIFYSVEVRNSKSGGWQVDLDDDAIQQIDFGSSRTGGQDDVIEQSLFMEDGLQALEEIEKSAHNNFSISGIKSML